MSDILVHTEAGVMTLTFNRLDKKNSITSAMYAELADALAAAEGDAAVRCVLIQGDPTIFSAGNDIGDFLNAPPAGEQSPVFRFLRGIAQFPKPIVAAVCGPAVGIGTTLLFHCDLVYAGDNAAFSMPFVNLGLCPEAASSLLVPQMFGYHRAAEALLLGDPFMAEAALEVGLVNRIVPPTEANAIAQGQARKLAAKPLSALVETKRLLKKAQLPAVLERMDEEGASFGRMLREPAAREAFGAFMEKRKPDFSKL
ncbi:enoyl-CoA hydratase/carnithine racemase [Variovorax sp. TBS-050B]|uniref:enoyl-CoA hydratase n=1 Tax=Variovorax sp. TBS-050B TaxID=2940551 RepID=UPI0024760D14|nr:enoyl-CoA hydratase [Variovorax sp. TBS-050B]MDH6592717.1 enoyl-CoA hydratase/carnithine racemase [Variovorax sp. TBS-050B]